MLFFCHLRIGGFFKVWGDGFFNRSSAFTLSSQGKFLTHKFLGGLVYLVEKHGDCADNHTKTGEQEIDDPRLVLHAVRDIGRDCIGGGFKDA